MAAGLIPDERTRRALARLEAAPLNFDPAELAAGTDAWSYDERLQPLAREQPGPPEPGGSWELARRLMRGYEFADPSLVRAYHDPAAPLEGRTLLLEVRFAGLRFRVGCRVAEVYERVEPVGDRDALVSGWSYRTLAGHVEQGEMHWQIAKWPETGEVAFRLFAWSRWARDVHPVVRAGIALFGRRAQLRFYDRTCARMRALTEAGLADAEPAAAVRAASERLGPQRTRDAPVHDELARNVGPERPG